MVRFFQTVPSASVDLRRDRAVGIDRVAAVDEEVRLVAAHGLVERMPPQSWLIPQPWPAVSPDQTKLTSVPALAGVRKLPVIGSDATPGVARSSKVTL